MKTARPFSEVIRFVVVGVLLCLFASSASAGWERPEGTSDEKLIRDLKECMYEADKYAPDATMNQVLIDPIGSGDVSARHNRVMQGCLELRGYKLTDDAKH